MNKKPYTNSYSVIGRIPNQTSSYTSSYINNYKNSIRKLFKYDKDSRVSYSKALFDDSGQQYIGWIIFTKEKTDRTNKTYELDYCGELEEIIKPQGFPSYENYKSHGNRRSELV